MKKLIVATLLLLIGIALPVQAFEIDLPPHYREDLEKKRLKEADTLWRDLDRGQVELAIRAFVGETPRFDGVDLSRFTSDFSWTKNGRVIATGGWHVFLAEWELSYPSLDSVRWNEAQLIVVFGYDWKTKIPRDDADAEIRLVFKLTREGSLFSKKAIRPEFLSADFGESYVMLPFGGVELRKAGPESEVKR